MPSREAETSKPSGWTSVRRPNAKTRDRRRKSQTLACHKKKPESRIRPAFDHKEQEGPVAFRGRMTASCVNAVIPYSRFVEYQERRGNMDAELLLADPPATMDAAVAWAGASAVS